MASSTPGTSVAFFTCLWIFVLAKDQQQITVKLGDDVTLQCLDHRGGDIELLEWTRQDPNENVFVWKHGKMFEDPQHPSFQNRVELRDPEMKDGDVSVTLKNININDIGTYKCHVRNGNKPTPPHLITKITLTVTDQQQITVKTGDDVTLQCLDHRGGDIELLEWTRQDPNENVFVWKHGKMFEDPQHPSFQNRVELRDPEMKDGDVSVILKNVTIKDTGTYKCRLRNNKTKSPPHLISTIILTVTVSGGEGGHTGEGGDDGGRFRLVVALLVCNVLLFIGMICMIYRKCYGHVKKNPSKQLFNTQPEMSIYC